MVWIAPEDLCPEVDSINQKVRDPGKPKHSPREALGGKQHRGSWQVEEDDIGQLADKGTPKVKIQPPKALEGGCTRGDFQRGLYRQENKRKAVAKQ